MDIPLNSSVIEYQHALPHKSKTELLYHEIGAAIVQGSYGMDGHIPATREIIAKYNCSRIVVREAIQILKSKGMVYTNMSQGTLVSPQPEWNLLDNDILNWLSNAPFSLSLMQELNQVMFTVELYCVKLAAQRAQQKQIEKINEAVIKIETAHLHYLNLLEAQIAFHVEVLFASENRFYKQFTNLFDVTMRYNKKFNDSHQVQESQSTDEYRIIYDCIRNQDQDGAMRASEQLLIKMIPNDLLHRGRTNRTTISISS